MSILACTWRSSSLLPRTLFVVREASRNEHAEHLKSMPRKAILVTTTRRVASLLWLQLLSLCTCCSCSRGLSKARPHELRQYHATTLTQQPHDKRCPNDDDQKITHDPKKQGSYGSLSWLASAPEYGHVLELPVQSVHLSIGSCL